MSTNEAPVIPVTRCADEMLVFHRQRWKMAPFALGIIALSEALAKWWKSSFPPPVGCLIVIGAILLPHALRMHRLLSSLPCGHCNQQARRYATRKDGRIVLTCRGCGKETLTDCIYPHRYSPPQKI